MVTVPSMWKFFWHWMLLSNDKLKLATEKSLVVKYSAELLLKMTSKDINPDAFKFNQNAYSYTFRYLNCPLEDKAELLGKTISAEQGLRDLMDERVVKTDAESLLKEFKGHFMYPRFAHMLSQPDFLVKVPMYLLDWYEYCQEMLRHLTQNKGE